MLTILQASLHLSSPSALYCLYCFQMKTFRLKGFNQLAQLANEERQFLVQAEANLSFCYENKLHLTEQRSVCKRLTGRCPRESPGPFIVLQQTYSPYMSATNLSQILTKSTLRTLIYSLPLFFLLFLFYPLSPTAHNQYPFSYIFWKFLFSENTVASQRWFLLHSPRGRPCAHTHPLFWTSFPFRSSQGTERAPVPDVSFVIYFSK